MLNKILNIDLISMLTFYKLLVVTNLILGFIPICDVNSRQ